MVGDVLGATVGDGEAVTIEIGSVVVGMADDELAIAGGAVGTVVDGPDAPLEPHAATTSARPIPTARRTPPRLHPLR